MLDERNTEETSAQASTTPIIAPEANTVQAKPSTRKWLLISGLSILVMSAITLLLVYVVSKVNSLNKNSTTPIKTLQIGNSSSKTSSQNTESTSNIPDAINPVNPAAIPIGTGKVSTSPQVGYVDLCNFNGNVAAEPNVPWINTSNDTWDSETKPSVEGSVSWSSTAYYNVNVSGDTRVISTNDEPIDHDSGVFPISISDPAHEYDGNPNHISAQPTTWDLPADPTAASTPSCTNDGPVGILNDGVFLFNALDANNRDGGATEIFDQWQGHPDSSDMYHHHMAPTFMLNEDTAKSSSMLIGYALDGYGIYIERDANGNLLTNANLDVCHGTTSDVMWNGKMTDIYHYVVTLEYPYTVGCFHATPIKTKISMNMSSGQNPPANQQPPMGKPN